MTISKLVDGKEFRLIFTPYIRNILVVSSYV
jgi:hypothetical protein